MPRPPRSKRVHLADGTVTVRGKAANGTGSVYYDRQSNRWVATWHTPDGRRRKISRPDRKTVLAAREQAIAAELAAQPQHRRFTRTTPLAELTTWWVESVAAHQVRPSSLAKYRDRCVRICATLGTVPLGELTVEALTDWQAGLLGELATGTVADTRSTLAQILGHAVRMDLLPRSPLDHVPRVEVRRRAAVALTADQARRLVELAADDRYGAAIALLFVAGWRVSEVLGLAWQDLDLDAGTAEVRRAAVYVDGAGMVLGPTKTKGAVGVHHLAPGVVDLLRRRRRIQAAERLAAGELWQTHSYEGVPVDLVFTAADGGLVLRQTIAERLKHLASRAGVDPTLVSTHTGRRTVVTALRRAGLPIEDIARHVGHSSPATTAGYVRGLGDRPAEVARVAAALLDVNAGS